MATNILPKGGDGFQGGIKTNREDLMPEVDGR
jgi:hypothetical protein